LSPSAGWLQKVAEDSSITLQTVIEEFKNISPELSKAFIFKRDGEIIASIEDNVVNDQAKKVAASFDEIAKQSEVIGGVEMLSIQGVNSQLKITSTNNRYLATVASRAADEKMVKALAYVIVPTVIKLLDQIDSGGKPADQVQAAVKETGTPTQSPEEPNQVSFPSIPAASSEQVIPKPPVNQFMVEKIGGLLVASDVVRINTELVHKWSELYGDREITQVNVETLEGKSVVCKFKPMKEADGSVRGIIQIPERILQTLGTGEGKLVMVKPFVST